MSKRYILQKNYTSTSNAKKFQRTFFISYISFFSYVLFLMLFVQSTYCDPVVIEMERANNFIQGIFQKRDRTRGKGGDQDYIYKCATPIIQYALKHPDLLWPENRFILYRPDSPSFIRYYSPDGRLGLAYITPHFKIHYSVSGDNAVFGSDGIPSNIPYYVIQFGSYFEQAWDQEINKLGYIAPPSDGSNGGDNRLDVYIIYMRNTFGYTQVENGHPFIVVNNDYTGFPENFDPEGHRAGSMKVTAAHEFFHAIQYFYDDWNDDCIWWEENTAVWIEDEVFDPVDDYLRYLPDKLRNFALPLDYQNKNFRNILYGGVIWAKFLSETYGKNIIRRIFERFLIDADLAKDAIEYTLHDYYSGWDKAMSQFCLKNLTMDYEEGDQYLYYSMADTFTEIIPNQNQIFSADIETGYSALGLNIRHLSCNYFKFAANTPMESIRINLTSQGTISPLILFVADQNITGDPIWDANDVHFWDLTHMTDMEFVLNEFGTSSTYPRAYLIVINPDPDSDNCLYSWTADIYPPVLQTPVIHYPVSGQIISFDQEYPPYEITLSVKNLPNDPNTDRDLEYIFELYENHNLSLVDFQIIPEDLNNSNGISSCQINLNESGVLYYWRCQARIANLNDTGFWTPLSSFYPLRVRNQVTNNVSPDPNFKIIEVIDPNSPIYGTSVKLLDLSQDIIIAHPIDPPISTGKIVPVGDWVYFGPDGLTFSKPATITLTYTLKELDDAGITDSNDLTDPNKLGIYQYKTKDPYFYAPLMKITSHHDLDNRTFKGDINHFSLYVVGFSTDSSQESNDYETGNIISKKGGGCFISVLP